MAVRLLDYEPVVGADVIAELRAVAGHVRRRRLQNINSTPVGGGVAEILTRLVPLLRELEVDASWDVIKGDEAFFNVTKVFHNALHGSQEEITEEMFEIYRSTTETNLQEVNFCGDVIFIHDLQPAWSPGRRTSAAVGSGAATSMFPRRIPASGTSSGPTWSSTISPSSPRRTSPGSSPSPSS